MPTGLRELKLWQEAVALAADALRLGRAAAKRETRVVTDRLMQAATDAAARIAAGYTHEAPDAQLARYRDARELLGEVETLLAAGRQAALLPSDAALAAAARVATVQRLLAGYLAYLDRQLAAPASAVPPPPAPGPTAPAVA